jgi:hypothetical protein
MRNDRERLRSYSAADDSIRSRRRTDAALSQKTFIHAIAPCAIGLLTGDGEDPRPLQLALDELVLLATRDSGVSEQLH